MIAWTQTKLAICWSVKKKLLDFFYNRSAREKTLNLSLIPTSFFTWNSSIKVFSLRLTSVEFRGCWHGPAVCLRVLVSWCCGLCFHLHWSRPVKTMNYRVTWCLAGWKDGSWKVWGWMSLLCRCWSCQRGRRWTESSSMRLHEWRGRHEWKEDAIRSPHRWFCFQAQVSLFNSSVAFLGKY